MTLRNTISTLLLVAVAITSADAQKKGKKESADAPKGYEFTVVKENYVTPVKNQANSGTCWSYSTVSFLESEAVKNGAPKDIDLADMYPVYMSYSDKAIKYVRLDGNLNYAQGGSFEDVIYTLKHYGMLPQAELEGLNYGTEKNAHGELSAVLKAYVGAVVKNPNKTLSTAWHRGLTGILDAYLGEVPEKFVVDGKEYTPQSYAKEYSNLSMTSIWANVLKNPLTRVRNTLRNHSMNHRALMLMIMYQSLHSHMSHSIHNLQLRFLITGAGVFHTMFLLMR